MCAREVATLAGLFAVCLVGGLVVALSGRIAAWHSRMYRQSAEQLDQRGRRLDPLARLWLRYARAQPEEREIAVWLRGIGAAVLLFGALMLLFQAYIWGLP